tara:strand:+ start:1680 stop:2141 length:462 start_codon:yes stop_codon:yes gene_type:complete
MATEPMINGTSYSWSQIEIHFSNITRPFSGVSNIDYADEMKSEFNFGANNLPVSRGHGNVVASGSITLHMEDIEALRGNILSGRLQDLGEFDVTVSFVHPDTSRIVTHTLKNCFLNENGVSVGQDDTNIEKQLNLNPSHILWNDSLIVGLGIV